jgi:hypothetical protein
VSQLEKDGRPREVESDASRGEPCGDGVPFGGPRPAPEPGSAGGLSASYEIAAGHSGAVDGDGDKLARIVYLALKHGLTYVRKSQEEYEAQMKEKQLKALKRKARQLGLELIEKPSAGSGTAAAPVQG